MEALPLGNGRLGMLSDGGVQHQRITLNESSMWSGSVDSTAWNAEAYKQLPAIRKLLLAGRAKEAEDLIYRSFVCGGVGSGRGQGANTPTAATKSAASFTSIGTRLPSSAVITVG